MVIFYKDLKGKKFMHEFNEEWFMVTVSVYNDTFNLTATTLLCIMTAKFWSWLDLMHKIFKKFIQILYLLFKH